MTPQLIEPFLGYGLGLRRIYHDEILAQRPSLDWFEIISEDYMVDGGPLFEQMMAIREYYPLVMHGVGLSLASADPLNQGYLKRLKQLQTRVRPQWVSDHLCWTTIDGWVSHDLLPICYNDEMLKHLVERIDAVQQVLGQRILLENVSSYVRFKMDVWQEWAFLDELLERADCLLLLDVNNVYVSSVNHQFDPLTYLQALPAHRVQQLHLAGHKDCTTHLLDTHDAPVSAQVWDLYKQAVHYFPQAAVMIERDSRFPALADLLSELSIARQLRSRVLHEEVTCPI